MSLLGVIFGSNREAKELEGEESVVEEVKEDESNQNDEKKRNGNQKRKKPEKVDTEKGKDDSKSKKKLKTNETGEVTEKASSSHMDTSPDDNGTTALEVPNLSEGSEFEKNLVDAEEALFRQCISLLEVDPMIYNGPEEKKKYIDLRENADIFRNIPGIETMSLSCFRQLRDRICYILSLQDNRLYSGNGERISKKNMHAWRGACRARKVPSLKSEGSKKQSSLACKCKGQFTLYRDGKLVISDKESHTCPELSDDVVSTDVRLLEYSQNPIRGCSKNPLTHKQEVTQILRELTSILDSNPHELEYLRKYYDEAKDRYTGSFCTSVPSTLATSTVESTLTKV